MIVCHAADAAVADFRLLMLPRVDKIRLLIPPLDIAYDSYYRRWFAHVMVPHAMLMSSLFMLIVYTPCLLLIHYHGAHAPIMPFACCAYYARFTFVYSVLYATVLLYMLLCLFSIMSP